MITDLPTQRIWALSQWQTFPGVFTYKMAAKINWHRFGTKLRYCRLMYTVAFLCANILRLSAISSVISVLAENSLTETLAQPCMYFYVLCFMLCAVICSTVRISDWFFVRLLFFLHVCVYVNQAAHVNVILINENDDDDNITMKIVFTFLQA